MVTLSRTILLPGPSKHFNASRSRRRDGMRVPGIFVVVAAVLAGGAPQSPDATQVLAGARQALGGEKKLSAVQSFILTGRTRQLRGNNLVPIVFEISCELPDRFVRVDEFPAQDQDPTTSGFNGNDLIQVPPPPSPAPQAAANQGRGDAPTGGRGAAPPAGRGDGPPAGRGGPPANPAMRRVITLKQDFARLALGMLAASFPSYPLTFKYLAEGQAPEGKADILDVAGPANFAAQLVVQRDTHLPVMLIWQQPATNVVFRVAGQPPPNAAPGTIVIDAPDPPAATATEDEKKAYASKVGELRRQTLAKAPPVEYRMYYGDFREVDGMKFPFRIRRAVAGDTIEETTFDKIRINPKIDPRKFEAAK
jgi:hypothetical protein